jgi:hypothetical protein
MVTVTIYERSSVLSGGAAAYPRSDLTNPFTHFRAASLDYVPQWISKEEGSQVARGRIGVRLQIQQQQESTITIGV